MAANLDPLPMSRRSHKCEANDTGIPKKGTHSVGVARRYCGPLGKQNNCQVAASLSAAGGHACLPIAFRLYLPRVWADDLDRPIRTAVQDDVVLLHWIGCTRPVPLGIDAELELVDAAYGTDADLRDGSFPDGTGPTPNLPRVLPPYASPGTSRSCTFRAAFRGMMPARMARQRTRTDQVISVHAACDYQRLPRRPPPSCIGGSSGTTRIASRNSGLATWRGEAGVAFVNPDAVHRRLRIPNPRKGRDFPPGEGNTVGIKEYSFPPGHRPRGSPDQT